MVLKEFWLDLETTGLNPWTNGVRQIGGIITLDGEEFDRVDLKLRPLPEDKVDNAALKVSNITKKELMSFPDPGEVKIEFTNILKRYVDQYNKQDKFVLYGYNVLKFDDEFLRNFFKKCGDSFYNSYFHYPPVDVMSKAMDALKYERHTLPNFKLETVAKHLGFEMEEEKAHDALYDVEITRKIYYALEDLNQKQNN